MSPIMWMFFPFLMMMMIMIVMVALVEESWEDYYENLNLFSSEFNMSW